MANEQNKYAGISTLRTFLSQLKNLFITKTDADAALSGKADKTHKHDSDYDAKGAANTALTSANAYTDENIGMLNDGFSEVIYQMYGDDLTENGAPTIRAIAIDEASTSLESAKEYVDSKMGNYVPTSRTVNGKALTSNITLSASDVGALPDTTSIPDALSDLSSDSTHRTVTDAEKATWNAKSNFSGNYNDLTNKPSIPSIAGLATETYADSAAVTAANKVKNDLLNGAGTAYDTLKELGDLIVDNADAIDALETIASGKADAEHSHAISDVSGLQSALDGKAASSHGTHVSFDSTNKPKMDGTAAFGSSSKVARADHVHPTDTTRAAQTDLDTHTENTTVHITSTERTNWNAAKTHADSAHAPSNAQPNQNAFSNIKVGSTTIAADTTTDTLELVGSNVTITPDATNDKVTIAVSDASTSTKGVVQLTNSTSSTSTTTAATPNSVKSAYDLANTAKTNAATAQTKADSAYTLAESKVDSLSDLGITATATELNYVDGVTSSVQAQLDAIKNAKADWNQNDSTQLDYVKNRPFYTTDPVETVIAEGTIPAGGMMQTTASIERLTLGETYSAVFDGTTYNNLVCENFDGLPSIGNDSFVFTIQSGRAMAYAANSSAHTIKVMANLATVVPLERKYIAEHIDNLAGEKVAGKVYTVDGAQVTAGEGAEVFNDYSTNIASGQYSHAEGMNNIASGATSHAEGWGTVASGSFSHAEGYETTASAHRSHAEGWSTEATAQGAHAEGFATHATGQNSHAEGDNATASGRASHAEGYGTKAVADYSHAEGMNTNASSEYQHVQGKYNIIDEADTYAHIVGNGASNSARKNAHTIDWSGNANFAGDVYVGNADANKAGKKLATEEYVTNTVNDAVNGIDYPVDSVNGKTGAVTLSASDVGARPNTWTPTASQVGAVAKSGDTMTGMLTLPKLVVDNSDWAQQIPFWNGSKEVGGIYRQNDNGLFVLYFRHPNAAAQEYYCMPLPNASLSENKWYDILTSKKPVTLAQGGTGATDAATARSNLGITPANIGAVPTSRTVNGKALTGNISLSAADVGARPSTWMPSAASVGARPSNWMPTAADVGAVPSSTGIQVYSRANIGTSPNFDNPNVNGLFEVRGAGETPGQSGAKPFEAYGAFLNLKTPDNIAMLQIAGAGNDFYIRAQQSAGVTMSGVSWKKVLTDKNTDYITAQGTSGVWTYRKWNSGIAECWAHIGYNGYQASGVWGSVYYAQVCSPTSYPFTFTDYPEVMASPYANSTGGDFWLCASGGNPGNTHSSPAFFAVTATQGAYIATGVSLYVVGKWK